MAGSDSSPAPPLWAVGQKSLDEKGSVYDFHDEISAYQSLNQEMTDFCAHVTPTQNEMEIRQKIVHRLDSYVKELWPSAKTKVYGSFMTGLYLPDSDIDLVIDGATDGFGGHSKLFMLKDQLELRNFSSSIQVILTAKVPVVKVVERYTGYRIDIGFDTKGSQENAKLIKKYVVVYPELRPLSLVLKYFLAQRHYKDAYHGGLPSHALVLLIISMLKYHPIDARLRHIEDSTLAVRLVQFFQLYGFDHLWDTTAVSIRARANTPFGGWRRKADMGWFDRTYLAVEDPFLHVNVASSCYNYSGIRDAFRSARYDLQTAFSTPSSVHHPTLLSYICSPTLYARAHQARTQIIPNGGSWWLAQ